MTALRLATVLAIAAVPVAAAPATAGWSPARPLPGSSTGDAGTPVLAVDGRGDVAAAWVDDPSATAARPLRHAVRSLRVAVRRAGARFAGRTLARGRDLAIQGVTVAMDARGELTVAWIDALPRGHHTVRAAYRTPGGRWSAVQAIGFSTAFFYAVPRLAVAADGRVLLSYVAGVRRAPGVGVAWRRPGHRFGALHAVGRLRVFDPVPAFDTAGRAYLSGIAPCEESSSRAILRVTAPGDHRFGPPRTIAPAPATEVRVHVTGDGTAVAAWVRAGCSTSELLAGPIMAAPIRDGAAGAAQILDQAAGRGVVLVGAPGRGAEASWTAFPPTAPGGAVLAARAAAAGVFGPADSPAQNWAAVAADAAGDQVVEPAQSVLSGPPAGVGARATGTDAVQPAPLTERAWFATAASASDGRALAAAAPVGGVLRVTTWTPAG